MIIFIKITLVYAIEGFTRVIRLLVRYVECSRGSELTKEVLGY